MNRAKVTNQPVDTRTTPAGLKAPLAEQEVFVNDDIHSDEYERVLTKEKQNLKQADKPEKNILIKANEEPCELIRILRIFCVIKN